MEYTFHSFNRIYNKSILLKFNDYPEKYPNQIL